MMLLTPYLLLILPFSAYNSVKTIRSERSTWITHLIGSADYKLPVCSHASKEAKSLAASERAAKPTTSQAGKAAEKSTPVLAATNKRGRSELSVAQAQTEITMKKAKQREITEFMFSGVNMPFTVAQQAAVEAQALRAIISANLAFRTFKNIEVSRLFGMIRSRAPAILPSGKVVGGRLLMEVAEKVELQVSQILHGNEIGLSYVHSNVFTCRAC